MERLHAADAAAASPVAPANDAPSSSSASSTVEAVAARVWEGCVPVVFSMDPTEVTALHAPRPFYAMIPRLSYLVSQTRDVIEFFQDAAPPMTAGAASIWFATADSAGESVPLPWHLPFGLLRDLVGRDAELPWRVTVHFLGFPAEQLLPCENERSVEQHFMHSLKQVLATFLRTGSTKAIMGLPEAQQNQIWSSVTTNDYAGYRAAMRDVLALDSDPATMRHLPLRVHLDTSPPIQMPIAPLRDGVEQTLGDALGYLLPDLFPSDENDDSHQHPSNGDTDTSSRQLIVHGIVVPPEVSIMELYRHFAYADGFLYVSVIESGPSSSP